MKIRFLAIFIFIFLISCVTSGVKVSYDKLSSFKIGTTTESQILNDLGQPTSSVFKTGGIKIYTYTYVSYQSNAASFIPIVGLLAGGADVETSSVTFTFNEGGILQDIQQVNMNSQANSGLLNQTNSGVPANKNRVIK